MGNQHNKGHKKGRSLSKRSSNASLESIALSVDSLDLIYIDDYFDDERYKKLVTKRLAEREKKKKERTARRKTKAFSDTAVSSKRKTNIIRPTPTISNRSQVSSQRLTTTSPSTKTVSPSRPVSVSSSKKSLVSKKSVHIRTPPHTKALPSSTLSTGDIPPSTDTSYLSVPREDKIAQTSSWHGEISDTNLPTPIQRESSGFIEKSNKPRSILTSSQHQDFSETVRRQRSYVIPSANYKGSPQRSHSVATDRSPATKDARKGSQPPTETMDPLPSDTDTQSRPKSVTKLKPKKKLIVRGFKNFVDSHKRESPLSSIGHYGHFSGGRGEGGGSGPAIWKREFPSKSKFHPDNFIYDWGEGPKAPVRPFSAMARCKKHGGRCKDCGLFTCDLRQSCRKCETDCACPSSSNRKTTFTNPYTQAEVHQEVFGGDGWNKACKVLCNLTQQEETNPVGGNASKRKQNCDENWAKNNFYKSQIDVLNPYNVPLTDAPPPGVMMHQPLSQHSMCVPPPPMFPMPFMPMMPMPMPMPASVLPYYLPPPPPCASYYDQCCSPPCPYSMSDSFMPAQNY